MSEATSALEKLIRAEKELLDTYQRHLPNRNIGFRHFYLCGAARRALAQSRAFRSCVEDKNGLVALAIVRLQLDTVLRLYALYWVADPEKFAKEVFNGKQIDRIKDGQGNLMKDRYLIDKISSKNPWVEAVYKNTSGLIHFSERHMRAAIRTKDENDDSIEIFIGPNNPKHECEDFEEMIAGFWHCTVMINVVADDWFSRVEPKQADL